MKQLEFPRNEVERLKAVEQYQVLDTLPEQDFDDITRIASEICQTPISLITLIDEKRQWFKSRQGLEVSETPREQAFCAYAILEPQEMMVVANPQEDERFYNNPLVTGEPRIRFYAGVPLVNPEGYALGTLCVIDQQTRELTPQQIASLKALARQVVAQLELRRKVRNLHESQTALQEANQLLEDFAYNASHDLKNPLNNILSIITLLEKELSEGNIKKVQRVFHHLSSSTHRLKDMVDRLLEFSRATGLSAQEKEWVDVTSLINEITSLIVVPPGFRISYFNLPSKVFTSRAALQHILSNLCTNAVKYNDKERGIVQVSGTEEAMYYRLQVKDNGPGIREEDYERIFGMFSTLGQKDRFNQQGTGLGLFIVKKLVEKMGGEIEVHSQLQEGTTFEFTLAKTDEYAEEQVKSEPSIDAR